MGFVQVGDVGSRISEFDFSKFRELKVQGEISSSKMKAPCSRV